MALKVSNKNRSKLKNHIENVEKEILSKLSDENNQLVVDELLEIKNPFASVPYETSFETEEELKRSIKEDTVKNQKAEFCKLQLITGFGIFVVLTFFLL